MIIDISGVLKSPVIIALLSISPFMFVTVYTVRYYCINICMYFTYVCILHMYMSKSIYPLLVLISFYHYIVLFLSFTKPSFCCHLYLHKISFSVSSLSVCIFCLK